MLKLDVCLETVFTDLPVEERIKRIAAAGYDCVEMWLHDDPAKNFTAIAKSLKETKITVNNMVVNAPDGNLGGSLVKKGDRETYLKRLRNLIPTAQSIGCTKAITCTGNEVAGLSRSEMKKNAIETLGMASEISGANGFTLFLESLNTYVDHPGYFLNSAKEAAEIVRKVNSPNLKLVYDIYHMQIMEGNLLAFIEMNLDIIGHFHAAGVPGRHELFSSEVDYRFIISKIEEMGYKGRFGLEYYPSMTDQGASLAAIKDYLTGNVNY
jgi:hydroxypyruvate isomerase